MTQSHSKTKKELGIPDHGSCWFWAENMGVSLMYGDGRGCSNVVHCNVSLPTISSSTEGMCYLYTVSCSQTLCHRVLID